MLGIGGHGANHADGKHAAVLSQFPPRHGRMAEDVAAFGHHPEVFQVAGVENQGVVGGHVLIDPGPEDPVHQGQGRVQFVSPDSAGLFHGETPGGSGAAAKIGVLVAEGF